jgi:hypothetical protein
VSPIDVSLSAFQIQFETVAASDDINGSPNTAWATFQLVHIAIIELSEITDYNNAYSDNSIFNPLLAQFCKSNRRSLQTSMPYPFAGASLQLVPTKPMVEVCNFDPISFFGLRPITKHSTP